MKVIHIESISQIHQMMGEEGPDHPLVSLIENSTTKPVSPTIPVLNTRFVSQLYTITLKSGEECGIKYGRKTYDFEAGSLMFMAPGQSIVPVESPNDLNQEGESWLLFFHPDLIRGTTLQEQIVRYAFFGYASNEALHLSDKERKKICDLVYAIREEYSQNLDGHSHRLIVSTLELLLNHCRRFYERQFITRSHLNEDLCSRFESYLAGHFSSASRSSRGLPSVTECAKAMGYSPNYLSDLLKQATGKGTRDHIHHHFVEKAKDLLLGSDKTVSEIAFALGFEYPQHFSKLFKRRTGQSPGEFRN